MYREKYLQNQSIALFIRSSSVLVSFVILEKSCQVSQMFMFMFFIAVFVPSIYNSKMKNRFNSVYRLRIMICYLTKYNFRYTKDKNSVGYYNHFRKDIL